MKSANGIEIKVGQRAMVLRNTGDHKTHDTAEFGPVIEDVVDVLGKIMHVTALGEVSQVFLQDHPDEDAAESMGWWLQHDIVILAEATQ